MLLRMAVRSRTRCGRRDRHGEPTPQIRHGHRTRIGTRRGRRALGCFAQAVLMLRFMRQRAAVADLARDDEVSLKTAYRYIHEALDVLVAQVPEPPDVATAAVASGEEHLLLDGTLIDTARVHDPGGQWDRWYSGKHRRHGGLVRVVCDADGRPLWVSPGEPVSTHDLTAARVTLCPWRVSRIAAMALVLSGSENRY